MSGADVVPGTGDALVGQRIGPYEVVAFLAAGGMGRVYRARDTKLPRDVALKVLPPDFVRDPERRARFEQEARVLATLAHPHINKIFGIEEYDGHLTLALEFVAGESVQDRVRRGAVPVAEALAIAQQVADALEAAHEQGVVHRDLKPANVRITPAGVVQVLDFGLAKVQPAVQGDGTALTTVLEPTALGQVLGTVAYMSPEQARGQPVDRRTDIWAFGCVLFELLTGQSPFARASVSDTPAALLEHEPAWDRLPATVPEAVRALLRRCLAKDRTRRWRDAGDLRLELEGAREALTREGAEDARVSPAGGQLATRVAVAASLFAVMALAAAGCGAAGSLLRTCRQ